MDGFLKQSTVATVKIGKYVDDTDGVTVEDGLTIAQADVRLCKNGGNIAQKNNTTACTHDEGGWYDCPLSTTDTNTLGLLKLDATVAGACPVYHNFMVVTANVYDTLFSTDRFDVNLIADQSAATIGTVTLTTTATTLTNKTGFSLAADQSAVTVGTVTTLTNKTGFALSAASIDAVWDEALAGHGVADSAGLALRNLLKIGKNKWSYVGTVFTIYNDNGTDILYSFNLDSASAPTSREPV